MGDKSPKSKERDAKKKDVQGQKDAAKSKAKQPQSGATAGKGGKK
jgi:hypothetical protein